MSLFGVWYFTDKDSVHYFIVISQLCLGSFSHSKTKHKFKKVDD